MEIKVPNNIELKDIFVDIHCMGKNPQGEGILIVIRKDNYVIYSALIDEYISKEIFEIEKIEKLDLICWSHPHDDHSEGIKDVIKEYSSKQTKIVVPIGITNFKKYMTKKCKKTYRLINKINRHNKKRNGEYIEVQQYSLLLENTYIDNCGRELSINIRTIAPVSKRVNNMKNSKSCDMNELSICLLVSINHANFLFTSDINNYIIGDMEIDKKKFENIVYYKIPHHGSNGSNNLLSYIPQSDNNRIAVSTIYSKNGQDKTPNLELLNRYINKGLMVFCTDKNYIKGKEKDVGYGIVSTRINISNCNNDEKLKWDIMFKEEATEVNEISKLCSFKTL